MAAWSINQLNKVDMGSLHHNLLWTDFPSVVGLIWQLLSMFFTKKFTCLVQAAGFPVYSMATPTVNGAKEMLEYLGAKSGAGGAAQRVVITDLREEAVVYIKGAPFVLRELDHPVDTLKHVGITGPLVSCRHLASRSGAPLWFSHGASSAESARRWRTWRGGSRRI